MTGLLHRLRVCGHSRSASGIAARRAKTRIAWLRAQHSPAAEGGDAQLPNPSKLRARLAKCLIAATFFALPSLAFADPCEGELPTRAGQTFSGIVRYIGDGDSLCVGQSSDPDSWIEVRLADFNAPELNVQGGRAAKAVLERIAMGRQAQCVAGGGRTGRVVSYDRVIATCRINGHRIGDLLREAGAEEGGR